MNKHNYSSIIAAAFHQVFEKHKDNVESLTKTHENNMEREEILFRQYPLEKKGKTFNTKESRTLRIDERVLKQVKKNGQERTLPDPTNVRQQQSINPQNNEDWPHKDHYYRLVLQFQERSPVCIYFKKLEACNEIRLFLLSKCYPEHKRTLMKAFKTQYQEKLRQQFIKSFCHNSFLPLEAPNKNAEEKYRKNVTSRILEQFSDKNCVKQFILQWHTKAILPSYQHPHTALEVPQMTIQFLQVISKKKQTISQGLLKVWIGNKTHGKIIKLNCERPKQGAFNALHYMVNESLNFNEQNLRLDTIMQLQLESQVIQQGETSNKGWRSQKFYLSQFLKTLNTGNTKSISLYSSSHNLQLHFRICNVSCTIYSSFQQKEQISPLDYPILRELISRQTLKKNITVLDSSILHEQYQQAYNEYRINQAVHSLCFNKCHKFINLLNVNAIVDKFFLNSSFSEFINVPHRATFVYRFLVNNSAKFSYIDAQKFVWKFQDHSMKRLLSVMKSFDQVPRINFTEPFYWLCKKCLELAEQQSMLRWDDGLFERSLFGRESAAFFIVLAILKLSSPILLYQPQKIFLANNSLLFHYILKFKLPNIYYKFLNIQLNAQALFGIQSTSLFSSLLSGDAYIWALQNFVFQRRKQTQNASEKGKQKNFVSLVSTFLSIIIVLDHCAPKSTYLSAKHYLNCLKLFCRHELQKHLQSISSLFDQYYGICQAVLAEREYQEFQNSLSAFHGTSNISSPDLNMTDILSQIFKEFSLYKPKHEADIRKIFIVVDHLKLGFVNLQDSSKNPSLLIFLHQKGSKIYEHQLVLNYALTKSGHSSLLQLDNVNHAIQLRLISLQEITLVFSIKYSANLHYSFSTQLDPRSIPSNFYVQDCFPLKPCFDSLYFDCYTLLQIYIKDSCDTDYIENSVPENYVGRLLLKDKLIGQEDTSILDDELQCSQAKKRALEDYKQDLIFASHFFRSFRIPECNFNLLYGKLGWYGCHYLIPDERVLQMYQISAPTQTENSPKVNPIAKTQRDRINEVLFYSRCIYGRGIIPCISQMGPLDAKLSIHSSRANLICEQAKPMRHQLNQLPYNSCANLACHLLPNTTIKDNFTEFYSKVVEELPLLQYLCFNPIQHYLLQSLSLSLKISLTSSSPTKPSHNVKQKVMASATKSIEIIFTNQPISIKTQTHTPYPFITSFQALQPYNKSSYHSQLAAELNNLPQLVFFTYCNDDVYLDCFLELLKLNILKYYISSDESRVVKKGSELWGTIKCSVHNYLPNYEVYRIYKLALQAHCNIDLEMALAPVETSRPKRQDIGKDFKDYGWLGGKWDGIQILARLVGPSYTVYYAEQKYTRRKIYLLENQVILTKGLSNSVETFKFTDKQILGVKECVVKELSHL